VFAAEKIPSRQFCLDRLALNSNRENGECKPKQKITPPAKNSTFKKIIFNRYKIFFTWNSTLIVIKMLNNIETKNLIDKQTFSNGNDETKCKISQASHKNNLIMKGAARPHDEKRHPTLS
jgi:hypothetical protein